MSSHFAISRRTLSIKSFLTLEMAGHKFEMKKPRRVLECGTTPRRHIAHGMVALLGKLFKGLLPPACVQGGRNIEWFTCVTSWPTCFPITTNTPLPRVHGVSGTRPSRTMWPRGPVTGLRHPLHSSQPFFFKSYNQTRVKHLKVRERDESQHHRSSFRAEICKVVRGFFVRVCVFVILKKINK